MPKTTLGATSASFLFFKYFIEKSILVREQLDMVSGQLPPRLGLGFLSRSGLVLGLGATRQLPPKKIASRLGLEFGLGLVLELWGNFPRGSCSRTT